MNAKRSTDLGSFSYEDEGLLSLLRQRDRNAQEAVWRAEQGRLTAMARGILKSEPDAEQLVADLFSDFFFHYVDQIRKARSIPAYLSIMVRRRAVRFRTRASKHIQLVPERSEAAQDAAADDLVDRHRWLRLLEKCLATLRPRARKILKLHYGHELSYTGIGRHMGTSKQAVGKTINSALSALRTCMTQSDAASG